MRIILIAAIIAVFFFANYFYEHQNMFISLERRCEVSTDCSFAPTKCCPGCDGYRPVNREYGINISKQFENCPNNCSHDPCYSPMGFIVIPRSVCQKGECIVIDEISCKAVCTYYHAIERDVLSREYLQKASDFLNLTQDTLVTSCGCLENESV